MKRIFAAWLLDIAKYVVTVLVLSTVLTDIVSGWLYYVASIGVVVSIVLLGFILYRSADKDDRKVRFNNLISN